MGLTSKTGICELAGKTGIKAVFGRAPAVWRAPDEWNSPVLPEPAAAGVLRRVGVMTFFKQGLTPFGEDFFQTADPIAFLLRDGQPEHPVNKGAVLKQDGEKLIHELV